jgi:hypothetical protein
MFEYIIIVFLFLASSYWIIRPLLSSEQLQGSLSPPLEERLNQVTLKKESAYATIKELEFDLSMGKLSKEDFEILKEQYTIDALKYMEEIDQLEGAEKIGSTPTDGKDKKNIENDNDGPVKDQMTLEANVFCTKCGEKASDQDHFCSKCGVELKKT